MKTMTCKQLGGACDTEFHAHSFDDIARMSKQHGVDMFQRQDAAHIEAVKKMQALMTRPEAMKEWFESKRKEFDALPDDSELEKRA